MPPKLSARALFGWGIAGIAVGVLLQVVPHVALGAVSSVSSVGVPVSIAISSIVWAAQALGVALLAASFVVRALTDDGVPPGPDDVASRTGPPGGPRPRSSGDDLT